MTSESPNGTILIYEIYFFTILNILNLKAKMKSPEYPK